MIAVFKTKRSGDTATTSRDVPLGPVSDLVVTDYSAPAALPRTGEREFFEAMQARLGAPGPGFPSLWPVAAALGDTGRRWLFHALYLLALNDATAPAAFQRAGAVARLVSRAGHPGTDPSAEDGSFEREVLTVSGWAAAVLAARLTSPTPEELAQLRLLYEPPPRQDVTLEEAVAAEAARWPSDGRPEPDDLERLRRVAARIQALVTDSCPPYAVARIDSPLHEGFAYAGRLRSAMEQPAGLDAQVAYLEDWAGPVPGLRGRLETDPGFSAQVAHLIKHTISHRNPEVDEYDGRASGVVYVPTFPPDEPKGAWRWQLVRDMIHELLHQLAHPRFAARATAALREELTRLLTDEVAAAAYDLATRDPTVWHALAGDADSGAPRKSGTMTEIMEIAGPDRVWAAYFLGETHLIGLTPPPGQMAR